MWAPSFPSDSATKVRIAKSAGTSFRCRVLVFILKGRSLCKANLIHILSVMLHGEAACCRASQQQAAAAASAAAEADATHLKQADGQAVLPARCSRQPFVSFVARPSPITNSVRLRGR